MRMHVLPTLEETELLNGPLAVAHMLRTTIPGLLNQKMIHRLQPYARQVAVEGSHCRLRLKEILQIVRRVDRTKKTLQTGEHELSDPMIRLCILTNGS